MSHRPRRVAAMDGEFAIPAYFDYLATFTWAMSGAIVGAPGRKLEEGASGGGEGGLSLWRTVSSRALHRMTNLERSIRAGVRFSQRARYGRAIKEGKDAVKMTRLSCHCFHSNEPRLGLSPLACNLRNLWWRRLVLPRGLRSGRR